VAWDAPGCGGSADPPAKWRLPDYADCLAGLIHALDLGRPHVGGLSWGGGLALELHRRHPQLPSSLVLASAYAGWAGSLPPEVVQERLQRVMREAELPPAQWVRGYLPGLFTDAAPAALVEEALAMMLEVRPAGMRPMVQGFAEADLRDVLPRIQVPTLLLYGDADRRRPWRWSPATCTPTFPAPGWWSSMGSSINPTWRPPTGSTPRSAAFSGQYSTELTSRLQRRRSRSLAAVRSVRSSPGRTSSARGQARGRAASASSAAGEVAPSRRRTAAARSGSVWGAACPVGGGQLEG
jgi:hypothetical protein